MTGRGYKVFTIRNTINMEIIPYYEFLDSTEQQYVINNTVNSSKWSFNGIPDSDQPNKIIFWYLPLDNDHFFTKKIFEKIKTTTNQNFSLERVYANGQTYGLSGSLHVDQELGNNQYYTFLYYVQPTWEPEWGGQTVFCDNKENGNNQYYTFLYYVQPNWLPEWGGQTVFYDDNEKMVFQQFPTPNLGILFNSEILHAGLEPTRLCKLLRVTVAFKLKLNN